MDTQLINIILGMKVRQARTEAGMTLSELAAQSNMSPSYMTEVEKGRKYPRADKIMRIATVLNKNYDDLVSITLDPSLADLGTALSSQTLRQFPFEEFGLGISDLLDLLTRAPDKASALLHALLDLGRQYDLRGEHFLRATLRSYQELHDNYFQELEDAADEFRSQYGLQDQLPITLDSVEEVLKQKFSYEIDDERLAQIPELATYRSVFVKGVQARLMLNPALQPEQRKFTLAREIAYKILRFEERSITSSPDPSISFAQTLNDFKASYLASAIIMPRALLLEDIEAFFAQTSWSPTPLLAMLKKYEVTSEMLLYRFCELIPHYFGLKMHFLRVEQMQNNEDSAAHHRYRIAKQLNMNRLLTPSGIALDEHFCRRWLVVRLLKNLQQQGAEGKVAEGKARESHDPVVGVQLSEFLEPRDRFLCFGFARPASLSGNSSSAIVGFRVEPGLQETMRFASDSDIPFVTINETCERCPLSDNQCKIRAAPPTVLDVQAQESRRKQALSQLVAQLRVAS